jgi:serine protease Do
MSRRSTYVTLSLTAAVAFFVGTIFAGGFRGPAAVSSPVPAAQAARSAARRPAPSPGTSIDFADIVEHINAAVVSIDASSKARAGKRKHNRHDEDDDLDDFDAPFDLGRGRRDTEIGDPNDPTRRGAGTGFIIDADGSILTNHHVIYRADRIMVRLSDGRSLRARVIGSDQATDIALIKIDGQGLPVAPLGDSSALRMGEWVCAIGNPLGYDHSVTVGVVSFLGRKLFDASLDDYIQTDAAINFGNSGGPLINSRGEVVGINAAISSHASGIGFAVPINGATVILDQLRSRGRVSRGYMGVTLRSVDADVQTSLKLPVARGALIQDVSGDSPGDRAGLRAYDTIIALDDRPVTNDDQLIHDIASRAPGTSVHVTLVRDSHEETIAVTLAERPVHEREPGRTGASTPADRVKADQNGPLGFVVRDLDRRSAERLEIPKSIHGVLVTKVEPLSASFDAGVERGVVLLEINRQPVETAAEYRRLARAVHAGDVLALYLYFPDIDQRRLVTLRVEDR